MRLLGSLLSAVFMMAPLSPSADRFPTIEAENLLGTKVTLPDAANGRATVFIIGFTHASQSAMKAWSRRLETDLHPYSIAVLEDVPRLVRGMAMHGIKGDVADNQKDHFFLVFHGEKELKIAVGFAAPNDAYVVLLDANGAIKWQSHRPPSDSAVAELKRQAQH